MIHIFSIGLKCMVSRVTFSPKVSMSLSLKLMNNPLPGTMGFPCVIKLKTFSRGNLELSRYAQYDHKGPYKAKVEESGSQKDM